MNTAPANFANPACEVCGKYFANSADSGGVCEVCGTHIFMNASSIKSDGNRKNTSLKYCKPRRNLRRLRFVMTRNYQKLPEFTRIEEKWWGETWDDLVDHMWSLVAHFINWSLTSWIEKYFVPEDFCFKSSLIHNLEKFYRVSSRIWFVQWPFLPST